MHRLSIFYIRSFLLLLLLTACGSKTGDSNAVPVLEYNDPLVNSVLKLSTEDIQLYYTDILSLRNSTKEYFQGDTSPLLEKDRKKFEGLNYYPVNVNYLIEAKFIEFKSKDTIIILTSKNKERKMLRAGQFEFKIDNKNLTLTAYLSVSQGDQSLFVPFADNTNNNDTYEAGRYLDIEYIGESTYYIDFNQAYSPYCAYNPKYSCPLVPLENAMDVEIKAGEKRYK